MVSSNHFAPLSVTIFLSQFAGAVTLRIQLAGGGSPLANGQYIIDDLSAYVVPEPSMIALLSVGGLFVLLRRKIAC